MAAIERYPRAKLGAKTIGAVLTTSAVVFKLAQRRYGTNMRADSSPLARFAQGFSGNLKKRANSGHWI
jgi:hypothetical protein